jgi:hypothetical protein
MATETMTAPRLPLWRAEAACKAELEWFFRTAKGRVPEEGECDPATREAAARIAGWLATLLTFYKGALELRFTPRFWPKALVVEFGPWTSLAVRLECAKRASEKARPLHEVEAEATSRLVEAIARREDVRELVRLRKHAEDHVTHALRGYLRARGVGPCVLPAGALERR